MRNLFRFLASLILISGLISGQTLQSHADEKISAYQALEFQISRSAMEYYSHSLQKTLHQPLVFEPDAPEHIFDGYDRCLQALTTEAFGSETGYCKVVGTMIPMLWSEDFGAEFISMSANALRETCTSKSLSEFVYPICRAVTSDSPIGRLVLSLHDQLATSDGVALQSWLQSELRSVELSKEVSLEDAITLMHLTDLYNLITAAVEDQTPDLEAYFETCRQACRTPSQISPKAGELALLNIKLKITLAQETH